jgi:hypothetical protein
MLQYVPLPCSYRVFQMFLQYTPITPLNSINRFAVVMEMECVYVRLVQYFEILIRPISMGV